jgi:sensor histidine kinase YesM
VTLEWIFIEIFVIIIEVGAVFYLLCNKFKSKYNSFVPTLFFILINIILIALPMFIGLYHLPIAEILGPISCLVFLILFRNGNILNKIFWTLISFSLIAASAFFSITITSYLSAVNTLDIILQSSTERFFSLIIGKTLQIVIFYSLAKKKRSFETKNILSPVPMLICCTVPFISIIVIFFIYIMLLNGIDISEEIIFSVAMSYLVINIIVFVLYEIINKEAEKNYVLIAQNKQYELTEEHNKQVIEIYDKMREWRHDYANHMQLVVGMLEKSDSNDNIDEAINYIKNMDEKIQSASLEIVTGNYIVDAIVSAKATLALAHNIKFEHNIFLPDDIAMESTDLCSILSNLLDNAIEACRKLEYGRYIELEMIMIKSQLVIKIANSANGEYKIENGRFKTTKRGDLHGIGMGHVKSIVENHDGIFDAKPEAESFIVQISIPLSGKQEK